MNSLLSIALALMIGLLMTRVFKVLKLRFPDVSAFLIAGLLVGPCCLGKLGVPGLGFADYDAVEAVSVINDVALGFIAFSIGNEFCLSQLKTVGRQATVVGIFQALTAAVLVDIALIVLHYAAPEIITVPVAITLGSIATATAPAATLMVVRQYKAKGPVTDILLPVVALDDAVGLAVFSVSFGIANAMETGNPDMISLLVNPIVEIVLSLVLGSLLGVVLTFLEKFFFSNSNRLSLTISFVLLTVALSALKFKVGAVSVSFSSLLVCMMLGTMFCNLCPLSHDLMNRADKWTAPLFALFFVISGADLQLSVLKTPAALIIGAVYIVFRCLGKYFGAYISCKKTNCPPQVTKYLGITLFPQAGVALGMCAAAASLGTESGLLVRNTILFSVLVYELVGPVLTRWALTKAGDIAPVSEEVSTRRVRGLEEAVKIKPVEQPILRHLKHLKKSGAPANK